jgi:hypothetical protein
MCKLDILNGNNYLGIIKRKALIGQVGPGWSRLLQVGQGWSRLVKVGQGWSRMVQVGGGGIDH